MNKNDLVKFSENNHTLYELLLFCYEHNIETIGCCAGHIEKGKRAYIGFKLNNHNNEYLLNIINNIKLPNFIISFVFDKRGNNNIGFKCLDDDVDSFFNFLKDNMNNKQHNNNNEDINYLYETIKLKQNVYDYTTIRVIIKNGDIKYYVNTQDINIIAILKEKCNYTILNEKQNLISFTLNNIKDLTLR